VSFKTSFDFDSHTNLVIVTVGVAIKTVEGIYGICDRVLSNLLWKFKMDA